MVSKLKVPDIDAELKDQLRGMGIGGSFFSSMFKMVKKVVKPLIKSTASSIIKAAKPKLTGLVKKGLSKFEKKTGLTTGINIDRLAGIAEEKLVDKLAGLGMGGFFGAILGKIAAPLIKGIVMPAALGMAQSFLG